MLDKASSQAINVFRSLTNEISVRVIPRPPDHYSETIRNMTVSAVNPTIQTIRAL
jgi:hypothetical protein